MGDPLQAQNVRVRGVKEAAKKKKETSKGDSNPPESLDWRNSSGFHSHCPQRSWTSDQRLRGEVHRGKGARMWEKKAPKKGTKKNNEHEQRESQGGYHDDASCLEDLMRVQNPC